MNMEQKTHTSEHEKKSIELQREKTCNKCGFSTVCLQVLYKHKYRCQGKLLATTPLSCVFCKRKFTYQTMFQKHKVTCVRRFRKKKNARKCRISRKKVEDKISSPKKSSASAFKCSKVFTSKSKLNKHLKGSEKKRNTFSARKSFPGGSEGKLKRMDQVDVDNDKNLFNNKEIFSYATCTWCKNSYPSRNILLKHYQKNPDCASAHIHHITKLRSRTTLTAKKSFSKGTMAAKKSFSKGSLTAKKTFLSPCFKYQPWCSTPMNANNTFVRKSFGGSFKSFKRKQNPILNKPMQSLNQCPVCFKEIPDPILFYQHQKTLSHWGKATKSSNLACRCPFCKKEFFHLAARNAHVRNHADKSKEDILTFLNNTKCDLCSEVFVSELAKCQHTKIKHATKALKDTLLSPEEADKLKFYSLPVDVKRSLQKSPKSCPICTEEFDTVSFRNSHFQNRHLDLEAQCNFCDMKDMDINIIEGHMEKDHFESFQFECIACGLKLATLPHFLIHASKFHSDKAVKSLIRPITKNSKTVKMSEEKLVHEDELICRTCNLTFTTVSALLSHRQSKSHKDLLIKNTSLSQSTADSKSQNEPLIVLTCNQCQGQFTSVKDFVPHRLSHLGKRGNYLKINEVDQYTCEICNESIDSHSKVQLHLFWHLQVGTLSEMSKQPERKNNFAENQQEIVIGGIKKTLFTCEMCNVGFTTQTHYDLHVRQLCQGKNDSTIDMSDTVFTKQKSEVSENPLGKLEHCPFCNCLYHSSISKDHENVCKKCYIEDSVLAPKDIEKLKFSIEPTEVAVCISCGYSFDAAENFSKHMLKTHSSNENALVLHDNVIEENKPKSVVRCSTCNCLILSADAVENHLQFCNHSYYENFDLSSCSNDLKAAVETESAIAVCIQCSCAFSSVESLSEHMKVEHNNVLPQSHDQEKVALQEETVSNDILPLEDIVLDNTQIDAAENNSELLDSLIVKQVNSDLGCTPENHLHSNKNNTSVEPLSTGGDHHPSGHENTDINSASGDCLNFEINGTSLANHLNLDGVTTEAIFTETGTLDNDSKVIAALRNNISILLQILITDVGLMQQMGFGEIPVDQVLVTVLQQMGETPVVSDGTVSELVCLRLNIQILLDICLKDQVQQMKANGVILTDDLVIEALKIFTEGNELVVVEG